MLHLLARNENHQFMKERDLSAVRFVMLSQILQLKAVVEPDFNIKVFSKTSEVYHFINKLQIQA